MSGEIVGPEGEYVEIPMFPYGPTRVFGWYAIVGWAPLYTMHGTVVRVARRVHGHRRLAVLGPKLVKRYNRGVRW